MQLFSELNLSFFNMYKYKYLDNMYNLNYDIKLLTQQLNNELNTLVNIPNNLNIQSNYNNEKLSTYLLKKKKKYIKKKKFFSKFKYDKLFGRVYYKLKNNFYKAYGMHEKNLPLYDYLKYLLTNNDKLLKEYKYN